MWTCVYVSALHVCGCPEKPEDGVKSLGSEVKKCQCWGLNPILPQ